VTKAARNIFTGLRAWPKPLWESAFGKTHFPTLFERFIAWPPSILFGQDGSSYYAASGRANRASVSR